MQRHDQYPGYINDIHAKQVFGKRQRAWVIFTRMYLSLLSRYTRRAPAL